MLSGKRIAVVVPARDEERHLEGVLDTMPGWVDDVIVVDDDPTLFGIDQEHLPGLQTGLST